MTVVRTLYLNKAGIQKCSLVHRQHSNRGIFSNHSLYCIPNSHQSLHCPAPGTPFWTSSPDLLPPHSSLLGNLQTPKTFPLSSANPSTPSRMPPLPGPRASAPMPSQEAGPPSAGPLGPCLRPTWQESPGHTLRQEDVYYPLNPCRGTLREQGLPPPLLQGLRNLSTGHPSSSKASGQGESRDVNARVGHWSLTCPHTSHSSTSEG